MAQLRQAREREQAHERRERLERETSSWWQVTAYPKCKQATVSPARGVMVNSRTGEVTLNRAPKGCRPRKRCETCQARGRTRRRCGECAQLRRRVGRSVTEVKPESERRSEMRSATMLHRYSREHGLDHMWSLTNAEACHDRQVMLARMEQFGREFASKTRSRRYPDGRPWLAVLELHKKEDPETGLTHGYHVHFCIRGFMDWRRLQPMWPHGKVWTPKKKEDGGPLAGRETGKSASWWDPTEAASYLTHYVSKDLGEGRTLLGQHRYLKARSMRLTVQRELVVGYVEGQERAIVLFGGVPPRELWESRDLPEGQWSGPTVARMDWWQVDTRRRR